MSREKKESRAREIEWGFEENEWQRVGHKIQATKEGLQVITRGFREVWEDQKRLEGTYSWLKERAHKDEKGERRKWGRGGLAREEESRN